MSQVLGYQPNARCIIFLLINREMAKDIRLRSCGRVEKFVATLQGEKRVRGASSMVSCVDIHTA